MQPIVRSKKRLFKAKVLFLGLTLFFAALWIFSEVRWLYFQTSSTFCQVTSGRIVFTCFWGDKVAVDGYHKVIRDDLTKNNNQYEGENQSLFVREAEYKSDSSLRLKLGIVLPRYLRQRLAVTGGSCEALILILPLWVPVFIFGPIAVFLVLFPRTIPPTHCQQCGYDLTANVSGKCPECGAAYSVDQIQSSTL